MMLNRTQIIVSIVGLVSLHACITNRHACKFEMTNEYIKTNCTLFNGLELKKLKDVAKIQDGIPNEYDIEFAATYGGSGEAFAKGMDEGLKKIVFNEEIKGYQWIWHKKNIVSSIIPFDFEVETWYMVTQLYQNGVPSVVLFIYVEKDGSFEVTRKDIPTNW